MLRIGITGANGFLGWHLRCHLHSRHDVQVTSLGHDGFFSKDLLHQFVGNLDVLVHLAGVNRASEDELRAGNIEPARLLVAACADIGATPHIIFANSTQSAHDSVYGLSKRQAAEILGEWSCSRGSRFTNMILPHLFGECGKPFYNSAISTFCHQIAAGQEPRILVDSELELVHAQRASAEIVKCIDSGTHGDRHLRGSRIRVSEVLEKIRSMASQYAAHVIPPMSSQLDLDLFNTYRCYLFPAHYPASLELRSDARGDLCEVVKSAHGGQGFVSSTRPEITRGNHYHRHKFERFLVLSGKAKIRVRRVLTQETVEFNVSGDNPAYIDMPALHTHNITNIGSGDLLTLFWSNEIFDPDNPDTFVEVV